VLRRGDDDGGTYGDRDVLLYTYTEMEHLSLHSFSTLPDLHPPPPPSPREFFLGFYADADGRERARAWAWTRARRPVTRSSHPAAGGFGAQQIGRL
jgi:hypothetical protein